LIGLLSAATEVIAVSGKPAGSGFLQRLLNERYSLTTVIEQDISHGQALRYKIATGNYLEIHNIDTPLIRADTLLVSNEPEELYGEGVIFEKNIDPGQKIRIVYYHQNQLNVPLFLNLVAVNSSPKTASIHIIPGQGGPSKDTLYTGHVATKRYFENLISEQGFFVSIAADSKALISSQKINSREVVSAVMEVSNLTENSQKLVLYATYNPYFRPDEAIHQPRIRNQISGLFPDPYLDLDLEVNLDGKMKYFRIGDSPFLVDLLTGRSLKGNYGLIYRYRIRLINTYNTRKSVVLYCSAHGGPARGVFVVDGKIIETGLLNPLSGRNITKLAEYEVTESRNIEIITIPQPGSNYPVSLIIKEAANDY